MFFLNNIYCKINSPNYYQYIILLLLFRSKQERYAAAEYFAENHAV